ncbi:hypothetical protein TNCV_4494851 [Trichonephila clavipes]|nr:hypothetical protein TNCV_4494851 [Trichonephila clavipes]
MLVRVYEDQALSMKCVYEWFARFREGQDSVSDNSRCGRPSTSVSDENIDKTFRDLLMRNNEGHLVDPTPWNLKSSFFGEKESRSRRKWMVGEEKEKRLLKTDFSGVRGKKRGRTMAALWKLSS